MEGALVGESLNVRTWASANAERRRYGKDWVDVEEERRGDLEMAFPAEGKVENEGWQVATLLGLPGEFLQELPATEKAVQALAE